MTRLPEVISTVQRRRAWSTEEKVAILDAAFSAGGSVAAAADRFGVSRSLIYIWRRQVRDGEMAGISITEHGIAAFASVAIAAEKSPGPGTRVSGTWGAVNPVPPERQTGEWRRCGSIEVWLGNGRAIKADEGIEPKVLARIAHALDGNGG